MSRGQTVDDSSKATSPRAWSRPRIRVLVNPNSGEKAGIPTNTADGG